MDPKITLPSTTWEWKSEDDGVVGYESTDTITVSNPGALSGTISSGYSTDTLTLSPPSLWNNTAITGGGYSYPNSVSATSTAGGPYTIGSNVSPWATYTSTPKIKLDGEGADIEVNGWSLMNMIGKIEQRLNILHPNDELEAEWAELRALGDQYRRLEKHIQEKQATWDRLKAMPPPEIK
jgi:hypothetical protein